MSFCLNPHCPQPKNEDGMRFCCSCGAPLELRGLYRAIAPMGQGGMGRTFRAVQLDTQTPCAIKQFYPRNQDPQLYEKALALFQREASQLKELGSHPQVPKFLDFFFQFNHWYLVQEFIDGTDLEVLLHSEGLFSESQIQELLRQILPVLTFLEQHQVIHRDIKPANLLRTRGGRYVLVDFGAAKTPIPQMTGTLIGTAEYAAPEQTQGRATYASDIYSLGVTCIHLLTGRSPFDLFDDYRQEWCWLEALPQPISPQLQLVLSRAITRPLALRYTDSSAMLMDLTSLGASVAQVCHLLQTQQWQSADQMTTELLSGEVSQIACDRLIRLDRAWREASQDRFGFSIQKNIWQSLGGQLSYAPNRQWEFAATYLKFSRQVGWQRQVWWRTQWIPPTQLNFSLQAPHGHLPTFCYQRGFNSTDAFFWRLTICEGTPS